MLLRLVYKRGGWKLEMENDKLMFIGVLYFVVGEDIILPQRTITACFREANSLPYGVCAKTRHTDKSKFENPHRVILDNRGGILYNMDRSPKDPCGDAAERICL